jgi:hypothetical protein
MKLRERKEGSRNVVEVRLLYPSRGLIMELSICGVQVAAAPKAPKHEKLRLNHSHHPSHPSVCNLDDPSSNLTVTTILQSSPLLNMTRAVGAFPTSPTSATGRSPLWIETPAKWPHRLANEAVATSGGA